MGIFGAHTVTLKNKRINNTKIKLSDAREIFQSFCDAFSRLIATTVKFFKGMVSYTQYGFIKNVLVFIKVGVLKMI